MKLVEHYIMRGTRRLVLIIVGLRAANFASFDKLRSALATDYVVQQDALQKEGDAVSGGVTLRRK